MKQQAKVSNLVVMKESRDTLTENVILTGHKRIAVVSRYYHHQMLNLMVAFKPPVGKKVVLVMVYLLSHTPCTIQTIFH